MSEEKRVAISNILNTTWCTCNRHKVIPTELSSGHHGNCPVHIAWYNIMYPTLYPGPRSY